MALKKTLTYRGLTIPGAYIRVDTMAGVKRQRRATPQVPGEAIWAATVGIYAAAGQDMPVIEMEITVPFDPAQRPMPQIYAALKALPDLADAEDV